ncbi:hypothetical protein [Sphingobacterium griseoflavum]|uniref:YtkA-like domain-containing protein n=1 Tax=Sphingobacterium griseoflavum TaxID=1474952 RepID=A0ABQ3HY64_9SPHI|nr:hypothetical protein [Sphingobacterium griseoflavum]GHE31925.1 hypothetical protein GCM10017764_13850 [Sphingobacterium griseoflavum]
MKQITLYLSAAMLLLAGACHNPESATTITTKQDSTSLERLDEAVKNSSPIIFERRKIAQQKDTLTFALDHPARVHIRLQTVEGTGNIRINQLFMPDGKADGPFGKTFDDSLAQTGNYRLVISESLMQENPYTGDYTVTIELK